MIAEGLQPAQQQLNSSYSDSPTKYYQFSTILEHFIDCVHTIVSDESNPYHQPFTGWLMRRQPKPMDEELFLDLMDDCKKRSQSMKNNSETQLSSSVKTRLEKCPQPLRREIVSRQQEGCAPLFVACRNGLTRIIKYLLDVCESDIEQKGRFEDPKNQRVHTVSPLWIAAVSGQLDVVKLLIDRGANVNSLSDTGSTSLRSVCYLCKDDDGTREYDNFHDGAFSFDALDDEQDGNDDIYMRIVYLLVEHGADVQKPNYRGGTCLSNSLHSYQLSKYIIDQGAEVDACDNQYQTALHRAIEDDRQLEVVKLLLTSGANPFKQTASHDDALQLSCMKGRMDVFNYLIKNYIYDTERLSDAHRLLGSSILEQNNCHDLTKVREYWSIALDIHQARLNQSDAISTRQTTSPTISEIPNGSVIHQVIPRSYDSMGVLPNKCDNRRQIAYGDTEEFRNLRELQTLTPDDFRLQSLLISERVLGSHHREFIQRLEHRGASYYKARRDNRCLDMWIYALKLRLDSSSVFHSESIKSAQEITRQFLELIKREQHQLVKFNDVFDVLHLLVGRLIDCEHHLSRRPRFCVHEDIFNLLLNMIVNLLLILRSVRRQRDEFDRTAQLINELVTLNPRSTNGSSLLHLCLLPNMLEGETQRFLMLSRYNNYLDDNPDLHSTGSPDRPNSPANDGCKVNGNSPLFELVSALIIAGLDVDSVNDEGLSPLQVLCLANGTRLSQKKNLISLLVKNGAHIDRRASTPERDQKIRRALQEAGVKPLKFVTLKCLAARAVSRMTLYTNDDSMILTRSLRESIAIH